MVGYLLDHGQELAGRLEEDALGLRATQRGRQSGVSIFFPLSGNNRAGVLMGTLAALVCREPLAGPLMSMPWLPA